MLCPFCLADSRFVRRVAPGARWPVHLCPYCNQQAPALYIHDYRRYPPVVCSAVGFRQHGKTVYFASLFHTLKRLKLADHWTRFFTMALNDDSLETVYENMGLLARGELPDSTPKNFPRPTMIRVHGIPVHRDCTLLCYDTAGECFQRPAELVQYANFVRRAKTVMLLFSLPDMSRPAVEMHELLNSYLVGMGELQGEPRRQHLTIVYTKGDRLESVFSGEYSDIHSYLANGDVNGLAELNDYAAEQAAISDRLRGFTERVLNATEFLHAVDVNFSSADFCVVSALGAAPEGARLPVEISPRRVLDPMFSVMRRSPGKWEWLRRLFRR